MQFNSILARIIFDMGDKNDDMCMTQEEFELKIHEVVLEIDGQTMSHLEYDLNTVFVDCDALNNASGVLTWHELKTCVEGMVVRLENEEAILAAFQYYSAISTEGEDYKLC